MTSYDPDEDWRPSGWLWSNTEALHQEYRVFWGLEPPVDLEERRPQANDATHALVAISEAIVPVLHSLAIDDTLRSRLADFAFGVDRNATDGFTEETALTVAKALSSHPLVRDAIRFDLAFTAAEAMLPRAEDRVPFLVQLVASRHISPRAAAYLDRATRLFLWGFDVESVAMCAASVEAALESVFPAERMFQLQISKKGQEFSSHEYESAAQAAGVFSASDRHAAKRLRRSRNDVMHNVPVTGLDVEDALKLAASLLTKIFPSPSAT
jgi:hypothetical protein